MIRICLVVAAILSYIPAHTQNYQIGTAQLTLIDQSRNRTIPVNVYYPANTGGIGVAVANSQAGFPVISFGHGFVIPAEAYSWLWEALVPQGYIVIFPKTEGQLLPAPDHAAFGEDIAFCARQIVQSSSQPASPVYGKVLPRIALMGHSMGGGATYLGAANTTDIATTITFAAAETNPSSIGAAQNVSLPSLVIASGEDCVTPANANQLPIFNNLPTQAKALITINGASHCNYTDGSAGACYLGETFSCFGFGPFISRAAQHQHTLDVLKPWLNTYLKSDCGAAQGFVQIAAEGIQNNLWTAQINGSEELQCPDACGIPSGFAITGSPAGGYTLHWDQVPFALGYNVQYRILGGPTLSANVFENAFSPTVTFLPGTYEYRVRALCPQLGSSGFSLWNSATLGSGKAAEMTVSGTVITIVGVNKEETHGILKVFTMDGRLVREVASTVSAGLPAMHQLEGLALGLYIAHFTSEEGVASLKFIIQ